MKPPSATIIFIITPVVTGTAMFSIPTAVSITEWAASPLLVIHFAACTSSFANVSIVTFDHWAIIAATVLLSFRYCHCRFLGEPGDADVVHETLRTYSVTPGTTGAAV